MLTIWVYRYRLKVWFISIDQGGDIVLKLCDSDYRFMSVVWDNEPLKSGELARLCFEQLGWKKSTTYTCIRKLCEKGYIENSGAVVRSLISREEAQVNETGLFVERTFDGSLPMFVSAFMKSRKLSDKDVLEIRKLIDEYEEEK